MKKINCVLFAVTALVVGACGEKPAPAQANAASKPATASVVAPLAAEEALLNIRNWPDYIPEGTLAAFEKETGIKVSYKNFKSNEELHLLLETRPSGDDIVVPSANYAGLQIQAALFQALDKTKIPNLKNLDAAIVANLQKTDPGNSHLVPWAWGFTTVGISGNKVAKALGDLPMPSNAWDLVFDPKYTQKLKSCGIAYMDNPAEIMPAAMHYLGKNPYSTNPDDYKIAVAMLETVRQDVTVLTKALIEPISTGKVCAVIGWTGDINAAAQKAKKNKVDDSFKALLPTTGALSFIDAMAIPKMASHPGNAHKFINFMLRPENAAAMVNEVGYPTGNKAALPLIDADIANNKTIFVEPLYFSKLVPQQSHSSLIRVTMTSDYMTFAYGTKSDKK